MPLRLSPSQRERRCPLALFMAGILVLMPSVGSLEDKNSQGVEATRREAVSAITRGDHVKSLALFQEALRQGGTSLTDWRVRLQLAQVLAALGQQTDALSEYRRLIGAAPEDAPPDVVAAGMLNTIVCMHHMRAADIFVHEQPPWWQHAQVERLETFEKVIAYYQMPCFSTRFGALRLQAR